MFGFYSVTVRSPQDFSVEKSVIFEVQDQSFGSHVQKEWEQSGRHGDKLEGAP